MISMKKSEILKLITTLRGSDKYIETIYTNGGCYQFYKILKSVFSCATPWVNFDKDHVVANINGVLYDITGEVKATKFMPLPDDMLEEVEKWSFSRTMFLSLGECKHCEEPFLIDAKGEL